MDRGKRGGLSKPRERLLLEHVGVAALRRLLRQRLLLELVPLLRHVRVLREVLRHHRGAEALLLHQAVVQRAVRRA